MRCGVWQLSENTETLNEVRHQQRYFFFAGFFSLLSFDSLEAASLLAASLATESFSLLPASFASVAGLSALSPSLAPGFFPPYSSPHQPPPLNLNKSPLLTPPTFP